MVFEEEAECERLKEVRVDPAPALLVKGLNVSCQLGILLFGSLHIIVQVLIEKVERGAAGLVDFEIVVGETIIHELQDRLNHLEVKFHHHQFQVVAEERLNKAETLLMEFIVDFNILVVQ